MIVVALVVAAVALLGVLLSAHRARDAAIAAIATIAVTRSELRPALVLARDDARRAATLHPPDRR